ncbi:MAG: hypothetical protein HY866_12920 [Chloroflexi bacterium]|nr:hypothetical protein [Chloroflexota bacterium]
MLRPVFLTKADRRSLNAKKTTVILAPSPRQPGVSVTCSTQRGTVTKSWYDPAILLLPGGKMMMSETNLRRALFSLLSIILIVLTAGVIGPLAPAHAQNACDGLVTPRLTSGGAARVISQYGLSMKNRAATGAAGASELAVLPYGTTIALTEAYTCNFGYVWWPIRLADGTTGFIAEGDASNYYLEPYTVGQHYYARSSDGAQIVHYLILPDGSSELQNVFPITPASGTPSQLWQPVETAWLTKAFEAVKTGCPERLAGTGLENATNETVLTTALPPLDYDFYPSPDGSRMVLVRHQHLVLPRCTSTVPERIGMSTVSIVEANGAERVLFPFPQHGTVPGSQDHYKPGEPTPWIVSLDEVVWSPNGKYVAFVAAYQDLCQGALCYRYHMYISNLETGQLYVTGEGRHVGWSNGGETINYFRLITGDLNAQNPHLYTMKPDGTNRQEVWLPGGARYVSDSRAPYGFPWNDGGTRVLVGNAGIAEVMLFTLSDRSFTPPVGVPDLTPLANRLMVGLIGGEKTLLWATIRGEFLTQSVSSGQWTKLTSEVASTGVAPRHVTPFPLVNRALIEMVDGSAYVLDLDADQLIPVRFEG